MNKTVCTLVSCILFISSADLFAGDKQSDKWKVSNPPYATHEIPLDVTSGTWMNLDVSPDGSEIIFDMLGDLYKMPIFGGEAEAITSTISWEMQPRFSPDGKRYSLYNDVNF